MLKLKIKKINNTAKLPQRVHEGDMFDVFSNANITINSFESTIIPLGIAMDIPAGYRIKLFSRSSLPLKRQLIVSNSVGIIDMNFKGELGLICHTMPKKDENSNHLINNPIDIKIGDKIAQIQLERIEYFQIIEVDEIDTTNDRGGGFGSTGE